MPYQYELDESSVLYAGHLADVAFPLFSHLVGQPVWFLEIGVYQAGAGCWMLDNILTHPDARYVGVDNRDHDALAAARANLALHGDKALLLEGDSAKIVPLLGKFDAIYIDGDHRRGPALTDLRNSWKKLLPGGIILLDDYTHPNYGVWEATKEFLAELPAGSYTTLVDSGNFAFRKNSGVLG